MLDTIKEWWAVLVTGGGVLVWLVRLEARGFETDRNIAELKRQYHADIVELKKQRHDDLVNAKDAREDTNRMLTEIRGDIKILIKESGKGHE